MGQALKNPICQKPRNKCDSRGIVYKIPCKSCDAVYVGETANTLAKRLIQHRGTVRCCNKASRLALHSMELNHIGKDLR